MQIELINIDEIIPYENNAKLHPQEQIEQIKKSILEFGNNDPIAIDKDNIIIEGHTSYKTAKKLGLNKVPCIVEDDLTEDQVNAFRLADNKVSEIATWDFNLLELELDNIIDIDMSEFSFDIQGIEDNFDTDFELPDEDKPQTRTITLSL